MIRAITFIQLFNSNVFVVDIYDYTKTVQDEKEPSTFFSYEEARKFLSQKRRKWLIEHYTNYVNHKSKLFRVSAGDHYRNRTSLDNLTRLESSLELIQTMPTPTMCDVILKAKSLLLSILPHRANASYDSSFATIYQIFAVAEDEINDVHGLFKSKSKSPKYY
jgi:hypothetical protein